MGVYKDDNAHIVADRVIKESGIKFTTTSEQRLKIRQLGQLLEVQINQKIADIAKEMKR